MELSVKNLTIEAAMKGHKRNRIADALSFSLTQGQRLAIVGQSGCGKTMTAMAILGLLPENCTARGSILWNGKNLLTMRDAARRSLLGTAHVLIPQSGADFLNPSLRIKTQMREMLLRNRIPKREHAAHAKRLLQQVGFEDSERLLHSYPFQLSGGMAQRVVMAMASVGTPQLVLADEPTKGIDQKNTAQFVSNLDTLFPDAAVILITHDISLAAICKQILVMKDGAIVESGDTKQVLAAPKSLYTHQLICDLPHALSHIDRGLR